MRVLALLLLVSSAFAAEVYDPTRFEKQVVVPASEGAIQLQVLGDGRVFFVELRGTLKLYDPRTGAVTALGRLPVAQHPRTHDRGALGFVLARDFESTGHLFFLYSPLAKEQSIRLARFTLRDGRLDLASEKFLLESPMEEISLGGHYGGGLAWTPAGDLVIGTGDFTPPRDNGTFDDRPGHETDDAQRTSANSMDLRGKILRIRPTPGGGYTIPPGNLFTDPKQGRPEIFAMGIRNPFRLSVDPTTGFVYWGDVGQNIRPALELGPEGYDEINQARGAGFFGFPYFTGPNEAYRQYDYETKQVGAVFDLKSPRNESRNNTGLRELPPPQPAFIWYPSTESKEFPMLGSGGRSAMAGPVYTFDPAVRNALKLPRHFDRTLFIHDWMRNWIMAVKLDAADRIAGIAPFLPQMKFRKPIAMQLAPDHSLYVIEWGDKWFENTDSRIVRLVYHRGNRAPTAVAEADVLAGKPPLTVRFDAGRSRDPDGDVLTHRWDVGEAGTRSSIAPEFVFRQPGQFPVTLTVTDPHGAVATARLVVTVGNAPPQVAFTAPANGGFYDAAETITYRVTVSDEEDGAIDARRVNVAATPRPRVSASAASVSPTEALMRATTCFACHQIGEKSVGPAFRDVAARYRDQEAARETLAQKILAGGGGAWGGEIPMPPHPQHTPEQVRPMVDWILALAAAPAGSVQTGTHGTILAPDFLPKDNKWWTHPMPPVLALEASYTDHGAAGAPGLRGSTTLVLHPRRKRAATYDQSHAVEIVDVFSGGQGNVVRMAPAGWFAFAEMNLVGIAELKVRLAPRRVGRGRIEVRLDSPEGEAVAAVPFSADSPGETGFRELTAKVSARAGARSVFFVARGDNGEGPRGAGQALEPLMVDINWIEFSAAASRGP